ncbi:pantetheine-phosphate adenylyltransferase [Ruminococcaceae bacterium OttesenSCG-928-I18]|nr:pantetheine-phosphate adenylyltransferase [Ruminococcaceae bacterium OttesenSCG-928-I18]
MRIAICPGSYDPVTNGHINIIERSTQLFDKVIVVVLVNPNKQTAFSREERVDLLKLALQGMPKIEVDTCDGLVAEYAREKGATALVKGLRAMSDFEYEFQMALINKRLNSELETVFITTDINNMFLSSSAVREVARFGGSLSGFVPKVIEPKLYERLAAQAGDAE